MGKVKSQAQNRVGDRPQQDLCDGAGRRGQNTPTTGAPHPHTPRSPTPFRRTLSRPMWMRSLVRKALGLKEAELKAFFIKASARQKQQGAGAS